VPSPAVPVNTRLPVPDYAKVSKLEYRKIRNFVTYQANLAGYDENGLWNMVIREVTRRHDNYVKGKAKSLLTLTDAADKICRAALKERMAMLNEAAEALS
jgi:hypothetical protein